MEFLIDSFDFKSNFLFSDLSTKEIEKVKATFEDLSFSRGDKLFYEDGIPTGVFFIKKGNVKKFKSTFEAEQIFYIYKTGDLLGYHALLSQERYQDSCTALNDVEISFISAERFHELLESLPLLKDSLIKNMAHEFGVMANFISVLAQKSQVKRLAILLLVLENRFNQNAIESDGVNISREDLANLIGTTRESLSRSIKELKDDGLIKVEKRVIHITDAKGLVTFVEQ